MNIYLSFKNPQSYQRLQKQIINGVAPTLSKLTYNEDNTQNIYQFDLNQYDYIVYGFEKLNQNQIVKFSIDESKIIGIDDGKGEYIQFNL